MSNGIDRVLSDFILESRENLERLDRAFVALESDPGNNELLASIFRTIHTIKGSAGFLSLANLEQVSHYAEDVLARLREHSLALTAEITTILLSGVDCIKSILFSLERTGEEGEHELLEVVTKLKNVADGKSIQEFKEKFAEKSGKVDAQHDIPGEHSFRGGLPCAESAGISGAGSRTQRRFSRSAEPADY